MKLYTRAISAPIKSFRPIYKNKVRVTAHFIVRWLERVHGLNLEPIRREVVKEYAGCTGNDGDVLMYLSKKGIPQYKLRDAAMPLKVQEAIEMGASRIPYGGYVYIADGGNLKTILS